MARQFGTWNFGLMQLGVQSEHANGYIDAPVAATDAWYGVFGGWEDDRVRTAFERSNGLSVPSTQQYDSRLGVTVPIPDTELTFEQFLHLGDIGLIHDAAPVDNTGTYTWDFNIPAATSPRATKFRTLEIGNTASNEDVHRIPGAFASEIKLSGRRGEAWKMSATLMGQRAIRKGSEGFTGFTAAIPFPTVVPVLFSDTKFYLDDSAGTIGTTEIPATVMSADITINTGIQFLPPGDGYLYPRYVKRGAPSVTFTMGMELWQDGATNIVATERDNFAADAVRLIRMETAGPGSREFVIDMAARWSKVGAYGQEEEINTVVPFEGFADYSSADSLFFGIAVTNLLSAML